MSVQAMAWAFEQRISNPADKLVLLSLANHAGRGTPFTFPGIQTVVDETSLPKRTVQRALSTLKQRGWIEVIETPAPGRPTMYRLAWTGAESAPVGRSTGAGRAPNGRQPPIRNAHAEPEPRTLRDDAAHHLAPTDDFVAHYVDDARAAGWDPTPRFNARIGREARELADAGKPRELILRAISQVAQGRRSPSALAFVVADLEAGRNGNGTRPHEPPGFDAARRFLNKHEGRKQ